MILLKLEPVRWSSSTIRIPVARRWSATIVPKVHARTEGEKGAVFAYAGLAHQLRTHIYSFPTRHPEFTRQRVKTPHPIG
jgi:hypothetical protein